jgi:hypothetical protein
MKNILLLFISSTFAAGIAGCGNNCRDVNCPPVKPAFFAFRLVNNNGKDLLTGAFKQYDSSQLRIRARNVSDGALVGVDRFFSYSGDTSAYSSFVAKQEHSVYYLQLNGVITDSFYFNYRNRATDCCNLSNFEFNRVNSTTVTPVELPASYILQK